MRVAVAGGTGVVGRHVVALAGGAGHDVVALTRSHGVDITTGEGLDLSGVDVVIDVSSVQTLKDDASREFFSAATRTLLDAEEAAGIRHHVALSIVGIDDAPFGYYAGKVEQERLITSGAVPWTILRATQFHEFAVQVLGRARVGPFALVPVMKSQPVAARDVAARLVELATDVPAGRVADLAGPRVERMAQLSRTWVRAQGKRTPVVEVPLPGALGKAMRDGRLLARRGAQLSSQTFDEWVGTQ